MRRLLAAPVILVPVAAAGALVWLTGLAWPIATTFARCFMHDPPEAEADPVG